MNLQRRFSRFLALFLSLLTLFTGLQITTAQAAMVSTQSLVQQQQLQYDRTQLSALLEREQAVEAMQAMDVEPEMVQKRVASMTQDELTAFNDQVNQMQAGGSALGVVVLVFLILILLDLLGVTDIFPVIHPINTK